MRLQKKESRQNSPGEKLRLLSGSIVDVMLCLFLILMLTVFPFYNQEGYSHIGTDKAVFFCRLGTWAGRALAIPLALYLLSGCSRLAGDIIRNGRSNRTGTAVSGKSGFPSSGMKKIFEGKASLPDLCALIYAGALLFSWLVTDYRTEALWGAKGWYMGLMPQTILLGIYFTVSRFWKPRKWLFCLSLPVSGAVFLMGCLNRFGIYAFGLESAGESYISTIGNLNWYCGYAVSVMFAGTILPWLGEGIKLWQKTLLMIYTAIGYLSLILQGSDSGLAALAAVMLVMFCMSAKDSGRMLVFWQEMTILSSECLGIFLVKNLAPGRINFMGMLAGILAGRAVSSVMTTVSILMMLLVWASRRRGKYREKLFCVLARAAAVGSACIVTGAVLLVVINTRHPGSLGRLSDNPLFTFNDAWGSHRGVTWLAGWKCFAAQDALHKLAGVGPDCMWPYINSGSNQEIYLYVTTAFPGLRLTNAHNEWLTVLVNTGIIGLAGYGGMMICGIGELLKKGKESPYAAACGFCLLAYTVNNIFSFQQAMGVGTVFVIFGMGKAFLRKGQKPVSKSPSLM